MQGVLNVFNQNNTFDIWWFSLEYSQPYYNHDNDNDDHHGNKFIFILNNVYIS
jgi:hypothetical protein